MPRVVPDQRSKFENEEFFRKLSRECEIKYTGFRDRPHEERQTRFQNACRDGRSEIVSRWARGRGEAAGGPRRAPLTCCARPGRVPDSAADAAAPGTKWAQAHFLVPIRMAKKADAGGSIGLRVGTRSFALAGCDGPWFPEQARLSEWSSNPSQASVVA